MPLAYHDGQFVEKSAIKISPSDYGFARGMTLFEFTRVYGCVAFHLDKHLQRFRNGAAAMGIPLPETDAELATAVQHLIDSNHFEHSGVKFYLTIGECGSPGDGGFMTCSDFTPHLMMLHDEFKPQHPEAPRGMEACQRGLALKIVPFFRNLPEAKSINYAAGFVAAQRLKGTDFDDILFTHPDGYVTETTVSNIFCTIDGKLHTPRHNMLEGVTRDLMFDLATTCGIETVETDINMPMLARATEAFITSSFIEMTPLRRIDDILFAKTTDAPVYEKIRRAYSQHIRDYCQTRVAA